ncbi:MAG: hypothetical protein ACE5JL_18925 [Dehalococcoidia bacterium]
MEERISIPGGCRSNNCGQPWGKAVEQDGGSALVCIQCGAFVEWLSEPVEADVEEAEEAEMVEEPPELDESLEEEE